MIVVEKTVLPVVGHVDVRPAIVIVILNGYTEAPSLVCHARFFRHFGERAIVIVVQQHGARRRLLPVERGKRGPVEQINVQPAVVIVVAEGDTGAGHFKDGGLLWSSGAMVEFVETRLLRNVDEYNRRAVHTSAGGNRPGQGVFHSGVRCASRHTRGLRLLPSTVIRFLRGGILPNPHRCQDGRQTAGVKNALSHRKSFGCDYFSTTLHLPAGCRRSWSFWMWKGQYCSKSPLRYMALSLTMASAIASVQRMPDRSMRSLMRFLQAPSTEPLAMGRPRARYWS